MSYFALSKTGRLTKVIPPALDQMQERARVVLACARIVPPRPQPAQQLFVRLPHHFRVFPCERDREGDGQCELRAVDVLGRDAGGLPHGGRAGEEHARGDGHDERVRALVQRDVCISL